MQHVLQLTKRHKSSSIVTLNYLRSRPGDMICGYLLPGFSPSHVLHVPPDCELLLKRFYMPVIFGFLALLWSIGELVSLQIKLFLTHSLTHQLSQSLSHLLIWYALTLADLCWLHLAVIQDMTLNSQAAQAVLWKGWKKNYERMKKKKKLVEK